jgi:peptidoglycan/LPS O-acetylase OafA/YrhL
MLALIPVYRALGLHDIIALPVTAAILFSACVLAGLILHSFVEQPLISLIRSERRAPAMAPTERAPAAIDLPSCLVTRRLKR